MADDVFARLRTDDCSCLNLVFNQLNIGIVMVDFDFRIIYANDEYHRILSHAPGSLINRSLDALLSGPALERQKQQLELLFSGRTESLHLESPFLRTDGTEVFTMLEGKLLCDKDGEAFCCIGTVIDISQRRHSERILVKRSKINSRLADFSNELLLLPSAADVRRSVLDKMREYSGALFAAYSDFIEKDDGMYLQIRNISSSNEVMDRIAGFVEKMNPNKLIMIDEQARRGMMEQTVTITDELKDFSLNTYSSSYDAALKKLLKIDLYAGIAIREPRNDVLLGAVMLTFKREYVPDEDYIRSLANIASSAIIRYNAEQQLLQK